MIFRVTDIETIPDPTAYTAGEPTYKLGPGGTSVPTEAFPPPQGQRVVAISYVDVEFDPALKPKYRYRSCYTDCRWGTTPETLESEERVLLEAWGEAMSEPEVHLVTWNGRGFDLPVIAMRTFKHGLPARWYYESKDVRYRYSTEGHLDLMDFLADYGSCRPMKLNDAARLIGLPGKTDMSGASIEGIYKESIRCGFAGEELTKVFASVARYCLHDSIQTAVIWMRTRHLLGKISPETYNQVLATIAEDRVIREVFPMDWDRLKLAL
jgi:predicted PolB exonuclease-like 3'-5' exonuclease